MPNFTVTLTQLQIDAIEHDSGLSISEATQAVMTDKATQVTVGLVHRRKREIEKAASRDSAELNEVAVVAFYRGQ